MAPDSRPLAGGTAARDFIEDAQSSLDSLNMR
jgi:hypothetical protein